MKEGKLPPTKFKKIVHFNSLLKKCKSGDIIYAASTDRIGRDFFDMMKLMKEAAKDGIEFIACKQNLSSVEPHCRSHYGHHGRGREETHTVRRRHFALDGTMTKAEP